MEKNSLFEEIFKHANNNELDILSSNMCSCVFCRHTYSAREVKDWISTDGGTNALCPNCGIDAVIGDSTGFTFDKASLKEINLYFYSEENMQKDPKALMTYVRRYKNGKITCNERNEGLFIKYSDTLARYGDYTACYDLGVLYDVGGTYTERDPMKAHYYYSADILHYDGEALTRLGLLYKSGNLGKVYPQKAYECFAKASSLCSLKGNIAFFDCYVEGLFVSSDPSFAFIGYSKLWGEAYRRFLRTTGRDATCLHHLCYRIGKMFMDGVGVPQDDVSAIKMLLLASYAFSVTRGDGPLTFIEDSEAYDDTMQRIEVLSRRHGWKKSEPIFDDDTFYDSFGEAKSADFRILKKCGFSPVFFDEENGLFTFKTTSALPLLIIDHKSLFCSFVDGEIKWTFGDVETATYSDNATFDLATGNLDDGWVFTYGDGNSMVSVATIVYAPDEVEDFENDEEVLS
ncbi:MAG: sel1 repeat family protein [Bacilli bacterium]|nr:sel1 repeat family protein [Bacilli bacterium]